MEDTYFCPLQLSVSLWHVTTAHAAKLLKSVDFLWKLVDNLDSHFNCPVTKCTVSEGSKEQTGCKKRRWEMFVLRFAEHNGFLLALHWRYESCRSASASNQREPAFILWHFLLLVIIALTGTVNYSACLLFSSATNVSWNFPRSYIFPGYRSVAPYSVAGCF
jgi:hypothetical protein